MPGSSSSWAKFAIAIILLAALLIVAIASSCALFPQTSKAIEQAPEGTLMALWRILEGLVADLLRFLA